PEVTAVAEAVLTQAMKDSGLSVTLDHFGWGSEHYLAHGRAMPLDAAETLRAYDAVLFGSFGTPALPDSEVVWRLIELRKELGLAANVRPVLQWPGVPTVFAGPREADLVVVRENTEGEYSGVGGRSTIQDDGGSVAIAVAVHSERTIAGLARYAFGLARRRRNHLTLISKANAIHHAFSLWEEVVEEVAAGFSDVEYDVCLVDAAAARMIQRPESFDVMLTSNLFGDVLSEIGATLAGGLGMCGSANVATDGRRPGLFEPIHGSAPDIAGRGIANPIGAVLSAAMLLDHLGHDEIGERIRQATREAVGQARTRDLGGTATTAEFGDLILKNLTTTTKGSDGAG
ncbi:MAG TPA: isocitrate/isopropylmalate dehydrogenase family protein, partial [Jatrophihabitans sp.]|nr:isocitrate/isopropylmalate dehydrogenase family protein [Jatrophihabitans sp.]